jgi:hypothetical protein
MTRNSHSVTILFFASSIPEIITFAPTVFKTRRLELTTISREIGSELMLFQIVRSVSIMLRM